MLERSPEAGDVEAVDGLVAGYLARAERFATRAVAVRAAGDGLVAASVGEWASALGERSGRLASGWDDAAGGCRQVAGVLAGYGAALRGLERRVMAARHGVETARIRAVAARERYAVAALAGGVASVPWAWTDVPAFAAVPDAAYELRVWRAAVGDAAEGLRVFARCCDEREELDRETAARLVGVEVMAAYAPGTGVDAIVDVPLVQALAASAAGTVTAAQRQVMAQWFAEAAQAMADDPEDVAAVRSLAGFLDAWGTDVDVMSAVFATLGGAATVRLVAELGNAVRFGNHRQNDTVAAVGVQVRAALAAGSLVWSKEEADTFADGMFGAVLFADGTASVIGYLFADSDKALMGAAFTVAVADRLDAWEREHGRVPQGVHQPGYWLAATGEPGTDPQQVLDPAAAVFGTLGVYPQAARDWLTGVAVDWSHDRARFDRARLDYWFGERDWSTQVSDGFAGLGSLWSGVQEVDGLLEAQQAAAINNIAFEQLAVNVALLQTENISAAGSRGLAEAVEAQMAGLIEVGVIRGPTSKDAAWESVATPLSSAGVVTAAVTRHEFVQILAAATSQPAGYGVVRDALLSYEADALNAAADGQASPSLVLHRLATVWGVADGAISGATQAEFQRACDDLRGAVGLARIPVDVALAHVPHPIVALGLDAAVGHIEQVAVNLLTPDATAPVLVRPPDADPIQHYFTSASETFRDAGLWDGPALRGDIAEPSTAHTDGADLHQVYADAAGAMRLAVLEAPTVNMKGDAG
ncbi:hypothetical protein J4038_14100 [Cellulomonas sp. zg-ZUI40]|nr:hypothetical protein [Cellulomonas dongxiuzhuiae]